VAAVNTFSQGTTVYTVLVQDLTGQASQAYIDQVVRLIQVAGARLSKWMPGGGNIDLEVILDPGVQIANGGSQISALTQVGMHGANKVFESAYSYEIRTGVDANGSAPDATIRINPNFQFWMDPSPETDGDVPFNAADFITMVQHELVHALGMLGYRDAAGALTSNVESVFDRFVTMVGGQPYFTGANAVAVYGGPVPLTPANLYHYGTQQSDPMSLLGGIMNGIGVMSGRRYDMNDLDLAILKDIGMLVSTAQDTYATLYGSVAADNLQATVRSQIFGIEGNDVLGGSSYNDVIHPGAGINTVDGGGGTDLAVFSGARAGYTITLAGAAATVSGAQGSNALTNVERLKFDDMNVALDIDGNAGKAYRLYQAAFDRVPDVAGVGFQMRELDVGWTLSDVAGNFIRSPEFQSKYGNLSDGQFVTLLYRNVLDREPEASGFQFHVSNLANGLSRAATLCGFSESPENKANVLPAIRNGMVYTVEGSGYPMSAAIDAGVDLVGVQQTDA
jgi:hypothetical protein